MTEVKACRWVAEFVEWYNHRHRHSAIRFVTPAQRHSGQAGETLRHRAHVYDVARQRRRPRGWSGSTRYWHQPEMVMINPPPPEKAYGPATLVKTS